MTEIRASPTLNRIGEINKGNYKMIYNIKYLVVEIRNKEFTGNINIQLVAA